MKRSVLLARREREQQAAAAAAGAVGGALPPFVHKTTLPSVAPAVAAAAAAPAAGGGDLRLPRWNGDISKKAAKREETNARNREETARKRARREGRDDTQTAASAAGGGGGGSDADEAHEGDADAAMQGGLDGNSDTPAAKTPHMSAAKLAFIQQQKQQQQHEAQLPVRMPSGSMLQTPLDDDALDMEDTPLVADAATAAAASSASVAAASSSGATASALPAFRSATPSSSSPLKKTPLKGTGLVVGMRPNANNREAAKEEEDLYFNVGFCKRTTKKHKTYEDGVLVVSGRRCIVKDLTSKTVSNALVSFCTRNLEEGGSYFVASSEVMLGTPIPAKEFLSGRCFVGSTTSAAESPLAAIKARQQQSLTPFAQVRASSGARSAGADAQAAAKAILDDPTALILNRRGVLDRHEKIVVVEPFLAKQLREHQRLGVQWLYDATMGVSSAGYEGAILADEMGLGKTLQAITLLYTLLHSSPHKIKGGECSKAIVVCPATLLSNWQREFTKWLCSHRCKPVVLTATLNAAEQQTRVRDFIGGVGKDYAVLIISYELFRKHAAALSVLERVLLVCDEGHRLKSTSSNKTIRALCQLKTRKRVMLTGTPVQNDLGEFFAMVDFVNPSILGSLSTFRKAFETPINQSRDANAASKVKLLGEERAQELQRRTQAFVLRRTSELLLQYLPEKVEQVLFIPLTPLQADIYKAVLVGKDVRRLLTSGAGNDALSLQCIGQLKKLANHPALVYEECCNQCEGSKPTVSARKHGGAEAKNAFDCYPENYVPVSHFSDVSESGKLRVLDHLLSLIRREGQKVVVVSNYIQTLDMLAHYLRAKEYGFLRLDGTTSAADRPAVVDRFNAPYASDHFVFLLSAKAGGVGLNLIGGNRLILFDPDWNPAVDLQAMSRVWRDGQKSTVYIYRFLATATIDEKIYMRQLRKNELSSSVLQGGASMDSDAAALRNFDAKSLRDIFSYRTDTRCDTIDVLRKTGKNEEERADRERNLGEFCTDLRQAKDPLLHDLPSELVSSFLNRVSSLEENRRQLAELTARAAAKLDKEGSVEDGDKNNKRTAECAVDEDGDENEEWENIAPSSAAASSRNHAPQDDEEDEEEAYQPPSFHAAAASAAASSAAPSSEAFSSPFTAPSLARGRANGTGRLVKPGSAPRRSAEVKKPLVPSGPAASWPTAEEEELAAQLAAQDDDEEDDDGAAHVEQMQEPEPSPSARARAQGQKRSRRIVEEDEEEDGAAGEEQEANDADELDHSSAAQQSAAAAGIAVDPMLEAAATSIVPPPKPVFLTLDTISRGVDED